MTNNEQVSLSMVTKHTLSKSNFEKKLEKFKELEELSEDVYKSNANDFACKTEYKIVLDGNEEYSLKLNSLNELNMYLHDHYNNGLGSPADLVYSIETCSSLPLAGEILE